MQHVRKLKHLEYTHVKVIHGTHTRVYYQFPKGYDNKYTGEVLRELRASKGVGNPKKVIKP